MFRTRPMRRLEALSLALPGVNVLLFIFLMWLTKTWPKRRHIALLTLLFLYTLLTLWLGIIILIITESQTL